MFKKYTNTMTFGSTVIEIVDQNWFDSIFSNNFSCISSGLMKHLCENRISITTVAFELALGPHINLFTLLVWAVGHTELRTTSLRNRHDTSGV